MITIAALCFAAAIAKGQPTIPSTFVLQPTAGDTSQPGFVWRIHQAYSPTTLPNLNTRTEEQLAGLLGVNYAAPWAQGVAIAPAAEASPETAPITFEIDSVINLSIYEGEWNGTFGPDSQMPGLPGMWLPPDYSYNSYDSAAAEILTWLDLPAGTNTFGVNSDDGFRFTLGGANPKDRFAAKVGEFNGGRGAADTLFSFTIAQAGLYAARCTWEQGTGGANIEMFSVQADGTRVLLNDIGGISAYRAVTAPARAYAQKVCPAPGGAARADAPILVELVDGQSPIDPATITLSVDGQRLTSASSKTGDTTTVSYTPSTLFAAGSHTVSFSYTEAGSPVTANWAFVALHYQGPNGNVYEFVPAAGISWQDALIAAEQRTFGCTHGHLVTLTSAEEDVFVQMLRKEYVAAGVIPDGEVWTGGYQEPGQTVLTAGWFWINNEGPIGGDAYANWYQPTGEPNDCCGTQYIEDGEENFLAIGFYSGWNDDDPTHGNAVGYVVEYEKMPVAIDIRPGGVPNPVNPVSPGKVPVAILSTPMFDAATVVASSVRFGRTGTEASPLSWLLTDVNHDRHKDLVCQFDNQETGFICGDTMGMVRASTVNGCFLVGQDSIKLLDCPAFALAVQPLLNVNHLTDIYLEVTPILQGHPAPTLAKNIVLKSYDIFGNLKWSKTVQRVPLLPGSGNSTGAHLQYTEVEHGQNIKAQVTVVDVLSGATEVLRQEGRVLYRPDLAVATISAPSQAITRQIVNIVATISEIRGDLGATATVILKDGGNTIDEVKEVHVPRFGTVNAVFSARFATPGTHPLTVVIDSTAPGDYDFSNNERPINLEILPPQPVEYCAQYSREEVDYQTVEENPYWIQVYHNAYTNEFAAQSLYSPYMVQFPITSISVAVYTDGAIQETFDLSAIPESYSYDDGCYVSRVATVYPSSDTSVYVESFHDCYGYQQTYASFAKSPFYQYYSESYHELWGGGYDYSYSYGTGKLLNATNSVAIAFVLQTDTSAFGGLGDVGPLYPYGWDDAWDYFYDWDYDGTPETHSTGSYRYLNVSGSKCDVTTP